MSGIAGLLHLDGSPVDVQLLRRMAGALAFRGPDAQGTCVSGSMGFAHTLLRTTDESAHERQPLSFDEKLWITADARVDARGELISKLREAGHPASASAPDVELILHAYRAWGEDCVLHLLGDFAFGIWDEPQRKLFCARDHFGVKPFFYAQVTNRFVFSNTLNCVRLHPSVSDRLNELAIADFLLFAENQDSSTSVFADVKRLPAAHMLSWTNQLLRVKRYWSLPADGHVRYKKDREYVEHFWSLFEQAVRDRLRTNRVVVSMSGGLDSPSVAAVAKRTLAERSSDFDLRALTYVFERLLPDREGHYAGEVAASLGIPIQFFCMDNLEPFGGLAEGVVHSPEPQLEPYSQLTAETYTHIAPTSRVLLTGHGGDPMMFPPVFYLMRLLREMRWWPLAKGFARFWSAFHRRPPLGGMRQRIRTWFGAPEESEEFPAWLEPGFLTRLNLADRWTEAKRPLPPQHRNCPEAYEKLTSRFWPKLFETQDAENFGVPLEIRQPFFDVRLVTFTLSIPPVPWYWDKMLLRQALTGVLPEKIRRRPKSPLAADPVAIYFRSQASHWVDSFAAVPELSNYILGDRIPKVAGSDPPGGWWLHLRPLALNLWLQSLPSSRYK